MTRTALFEPPRPVSSRRPKARCPLPSLLLRRARSESGTVLPGRGAAAGTSRTQAAREIWPGRPGCRNQRLAKFFFWNPSLHAVPESGPKSARQKKKVRSHNKKKSKKRSAAVTKRSAVPSQCHCRLGQQTVQGPRASPWHFDAVRCQAELRAHFWPRRHGPGQPTRITAPAAQADSQGGRRHAAGLQPPSPGFGSSECAA